MIRISHLEIPDIKLIRRNAFPDRRGFFSEMYRQTVYEEAGITTIFVQDNYSYSKKGIIRGMHFQSKPGQAKLITVIDGVIYDVFVDIRIDSPTFGKWGAYELVSERQEQLFIPEGFAHGFAVLSPSAHVIYKVSSCFDAKSEKTFHYDDPFVGIKWPFEEPILSDKDQEAPCFHEVVR